jgi:hypothetical protein
LLPDPADERTGLEAFGLLGIAATRGRSGKLRIDHASFSGTTYSRGRGNMSVRARLFAMLAGALMTLAVCVGISTFFLDRLASLQDVGFGKTQSQAVAAEASWLGTQYYQVIADTIINRDIK